MIWLKITIEDQREETPRKAEFCFEGGLISFVEFLNKNKEKLHKTPIYIEKNGEVPSVQFDNAFTTEAPTPWSPPDTLWVHQ